MHDLMNEGNQHNTKHKLDLHSKYLDFRYEMQTPSNLITHVAAWVWLDYICGETWIIARHYLLCIYGSKYQLCLLRNLIW